MKKAILSVLVSFSIISLAKSQNIGATLGWNIASVNSNEIEDLSSKFNFTASLFAEFMLSEKLGLQPELMISGQGYKFSADDNGTFNHWKQKLTYVNVPILANYYVAENFFLQAGPYLGILTNAEQNPIGLLGLVSEVNKDDFNSTDFGAAIGVGLKVTNINIGVRYQFGLSDIAEDARTIKNSVVNVAVGYRFVEQ